MATSQELEELAGPGSQDEAVMARILGEVVGCWSMKRACEIFADYRKSPRLLEPEIRLEVEEAMRIFGFIRAERLSCAEICDEADAQEERDYGSASNQSARVAAGKIRQRDRARSKDASHE